MHSFFLLFVTTDHHASVTHIPPLHRIHSHKTLLRRHLHLRHPPHHRDLHPLHRAQLRTPLARRGNLLLGAPHLLPRYGPDAAHGDRRGLPLQGQAHPRLLPPLRRPGGCRRRHGGRHHKNGLHHHRLPRPLHLPRPRWHAPRGLRRAHGPQGWVLEGEGWFHAFLQEGEWVLRCAWDCWGVGWRLRRSILRMRVSLLLCMEMVLPIRDSSLRRLALLRFGIFLLFWSARIITVNGMGTAEWRAAKSPAYYKRGDYVPGLKVDGMDVLAVKQACKFAKEHALKNGLLILEMDTYRYHGHSMSDHGSTYCTRDEISGVRQDIEKEVRKEVDEAIAKAKENPMPDPSDLFTIVYIKGYGVETFGADRKEVRATLP
ncbi:hypothetical protein AAZX31_01G036100 [Glycine max]